LAVIQCWISGVATTGSDAAAIERHLDQGAVDLHLLDGSGDLGGKARRQFLGQNQANFAARHRRRQQRQIGGIDHTVLVQVCNAVRARSPVA